MIPESMRVFRKSAVILLLLLTLLIMPHFLERLFVYYPVKGVTANPSSVGLDYSDVFLLTEDRVRIHGWFVPHPAGRTTLLIFHGNAGNIGHRLPWIELLHGLGAHVLIIDYRGYGRSEGEPFEAGLYRDALAAYDWWLRERGGSGERLVLIGESLGGAVAVDLASRFPVAGVVVQSSFTTAWEMAKTIPPLGWLQPLTRIRFDSSAKIRKLACPKLIIHGDRDEVVPLRLGRKLYELASEPKEFYEVAGAGHDDLIWTAGPEYTRRLGNFLARI